MERMLPMVIKQPLSYITKEFFMMRNAGPMVRLIEKNYKKVPEKLKFDIMMTKFIGRRIFPIVMGADTICFELYEGGVIVTMVLIDEEEGHSASFVDVYI